MPVTPSRSSHIWGYQSNTLTGAGRVRRKLEGTIAKGERLRVYEVVTVDIGKWRGYQAKTSDGFRWARINGEHIDVTKERPCQ